METAAHPRFLFKPRTFGMIFVTFTSSSSLWTGVVNTFRCATYAMSIADRHQAFLDAVASGDNSARWDALVAARQHLKHFGDTDWLWVESSLNDAERKWFVAAIFDRESLPRRLLPAMIRAAVLERNVSNNRAFIDPCLRTYGLARVKQLVDGYLESDVPGGPSGAERLQYWLREPREKRGTF